MKKFTFGFLFILFAFYGKSQTFQNIKSFNAGKNAVKKIAISGDTKYVSAATNEQISIWDLNGSKSVNPTSGKDYIFFGNNASEALIGTYSDIKVINALDGSTKFELKGKEEIITHALFSPALSYILTVGENGNIYMWTASNGELINELNISKAALTSAAISNSGKTIAVADINKTLYIIDAQSNSIINTQENLSDVVADLFFSKNDNLLYTVLEDKTAHALDINSLNEVSLLGSGITKSLAISPDGQYLALGTIANEIHFFQIENHTLYKKISSLKSIVTDLEFSQDGKTLVSGSEDGTVKIWDVSSLKITPSLYYTNNYAPKISISEIVLKEDNNNNIIDVNEKAKLLLTIKNASKANASNLYLKLNPKQTLNVLGLADSVLIGDIAGNTQKQIELAIKPNTSSTKNEKIKLIVKDKNKKMYGDTIEFFINFKAPAKPKAQLVNHEVLSDFNNQIRKGKSFRLKLYFSNPSSSSITNVKASLKLPAKVTLYDDKNLAIASLNSNETNSLEYGIIVNESYSSNTIPLKVIVTESEGQNEQEFPLVLDVENNVSSANTNNEMQTENQPKMRGSGDPLKGINVSKANKEIKVGRYFVFIVGIDKYKGVWPPLKNAVNDAKAIENLFKAKYKFDSFKTMYNEQATRTEIINHLEWLVANVKENDNLLIYYSGHGELKKQLNKGYWVPVDATTNSTSQYISNSEIQTFLGGIKSKHTLLISDACFSGDIFRGNTVSVPFENTDKYYANVYDKISRQAISSGGLEPVMDGGRDGHSVFAYYLLKALNKNENKYYDASQLYSDIKIPVVNNSDQTPDFKAVKNAEDEGGHFIFIKKQ